LPNTNSIDQKPVNISIDRKIKAI